MDRRQLLGILAGTTGITGCLQLTDPETGSPNASTEEDTRTASNPTEHTTTIKTENNSTPTRQAQEKTQTATPSGPPWTFELPAPPETGPVVENSTVYIACTDRHVYAVDAQTGEQQWRFNAEHSYFDSLTVIENTVYVSTQRKNFILDASAGNQVQSLPITGLIEVTSKRIYTTWKGNITCFNRSTLDKVWESTVDRSYGRQEDLVEGGGVILYSDIGDFVSDSNDMGERQKDPRIVALHTDTGEVIWEVSEHISEYDSTGIQLLPLEIGIGIVSFSDGQIKALSLKDTSTLWKAQLEVNNKHSNASYQLFKFGEHIAIIFENTLYAFNPKSGEVRWTIEAGLWSLSNVPSQSLPIRNGVGYFLGDSKIVGIDTSGNIVNTTSIDSNPSESAIGIADRAFYVGYDMGLRAYSRGKNS